MDMMRVLAVCAVMVSVVCAVIMLSVNHFKDRSYTWDGSGKSELTGGSAPNVCWIK